MNFGQLAIPHFRYYSCDSLEKDKNAICRRYKANVRCAPNALRIAEKLTEKTNWAVLGLGTLKIARRFSEILSGS
ncbi:hypothetical protein HQ563_13340 [bacterium]|nr:hypothetical protein [bacterium]